MNDDTIKVKRVRLHKILDNKQLPPEPKNHLERILEFSQHMVDTDQIPTVKLEPLSHGVIARTNAFIHNTPGMVVLLRTKETEWQEARVTQLRPSLSLGWVEVTCFTRKQQYVFEVTANWAFVMKLQYP